MLLTRDDKALLICWTALFVVAVGSLAMLGCAEPVEVAILTDDKLGLVLPPNADDCADGAVYGDTGVGC